MPRVFYTEKDIEGMVKSGTFSLELNDNVMLTDLAYEKANQLGLKLVGEASANPPTAPMRPYISWQTPQTHPEVDPDAADPHPTGGDLQKRIRSAVLTTMGNQVDPALLDVIIQRVIASTGVK